jgi:hypothetical protein
VGRLITTSAISAITLISSCSYMQIDIQKNVPPVLSLDLNLAILLNFPKVKKVLRDVDKL